MPPRIFLFSYLIGTTAFMSSLALAKPCKVIFEKNKEAGEVLTSGMMHLNRGDQIKIVRIEGCGKDLSIAIPGLKRSESELPINDMNQLIDTAYDLNSTQYKQKKFFVEILDATQKSIARLHVGFLEPELFYLVLSSTGNERIARNGDSVEVMASEKIKVLRLETNLNDKKLINIEFKPHTNYKTQQKIVQMIVKYQNFKVATIATRIANP